MIKLIEASLRPQTICGNVAKKAKEFMKQAQMEPLITDDAVYRREGVGDLKIAAASHIDDFLIVGEQAEVEQLVEKLGSLAQISKLEGK